MPKQNKNQLPGGGAGITRDLYNAVRKYDRKDFEDWADGLYGAAYEKGLGKGLAGAERARQEGYADGLRDAVEAAGKIKGVGPKKLQELAAALGIPEGSEL